MATDTVTVDADFMAKLFIILAAFWASTATAAPMGEDDARHLLERSGFGAPPALLAEYARLDRRQAVDRLLDGTARGLHGTPPAIAYQRPGALKNLNDEERKAYQQQAMQEGIALRAWWIAEMLQAATAEEALREHMTLFWHNHFVSSQQKVKSGQLMLQQNALLRQHALGNFSVLLHAVAKDPAMLVYLDNASNRQASPNENFAREVMELFTLGEGNYSETDIKEAARAFTGWSFAPETGEYRWRPAIHDRGEKQVLGHRGRLDGDAVLDILLLQPSTAEFIARKLWLEFVSPTPEPAELRRIAAALRTAGYDIRAALRALFLSEAFWAEKNRGSLIKSPVDIVIGSVRSLAVDVQETRFLVHALRQMGQDLFAPPNVRGWPGGEQWINSGSLLARKQFVDRLLRRVEMRGDSSRALQSPAFQLK